MMNRKIALKAFVFVMFGMSGAAAKGQEGKGLWGVKPLPLETVRSKAGFAILTPEASSGQFVLQKAEIAWVQKYQDNRDHLPARKVVCLFYKIRGKTLAAIVEAKVPSGDNTGNGNVYQAVGEGYFFDEYKVGTWLISERVHGTDFLIVTKVKSDGVALRDALIAQTK
jgi:hypothetical protein